jgi:hypothetical protein
MLRYGSIIIVILVSCLLPLSSHGSTAINHVDPEVVVEGLVVVTHVRPTEVDAALLLFRSLWASNDAISTKCLTNLANVDCLSALQAHVCISDVGEEEFGVLRDRFAAIDVIATKLVRPVHPEMVSWEDVSSENLSLASASDDNFSRLQCASEVGEIYLLNSATVLYIDRSYFVVTDLRSALSSMSRFPRSGNLFLCHPSFIHPGRTGTPTVNNLPTTETFCGYQLFTFSSRHSARLLAALNASLTFAHTEIPIMTVVAALEAVVRDVIGASAYLDALFVVDAGRDWDQTIPAQAVAFIEFDGVEQQITTSDCVVQIFVLWPHYNTVPIISELLHTVISDDVKTQLVAGCTDDAIPVRNRYQRKNVGHVDELLKNRTLQILVGSSRVRVFDTIIFNDELELLLLRLRKLATVVDYHIIVESNTTFTGRSKPLHFDKHRYLFGKYWHKIIHVIVDKLPHSGTIAEDTHIWANEYYSRSQAHLGLVAAGARDEDIVLVGDVDELPYPSAIDTLKKIFAVDTLLLTQTAPTIGRYGSRGNIFKLYPMNFLYHFNCFAGVGGPLRNGALTATTWKTARTLGSDDHYLSNLRHFMQKSNRYYRLKYVIYPGTLHLSFFGGLERIRSKLASYSHQNFARDYVEITGEASSSIFITNGSLSQALIESTIAEGVNINKNAETAACRTVSLDSYASYVKAGWKQIKAIKMHDQPSTTAIAVTATADRTVAVSRAPGSVDDDINDETLGYDADDDHDGYFNRVRVAFVTGCIVSSTDNVFIPRPIPHPEVDSIFVTNDLAVAEHAAAAGFATIVLGDIPVLNVSSVDAEITNSMHSKHLKVFPQYYARLAFPNVTYDFVLWMDNKYDVEWPKLQGELRQWPSQTAIMMPRPVLGRGVSVAYKACLGQERYARGKAALDDYIREQNITLGYPLDPADASDDQSYCSAFIIYSLRHSSTAAIQQMWYDHIQRAGIQCQISLYFVAHRFKTAIQEYRHPLWSEGGRITFHRNFDEAKKLLTEEAISRFEKQEKEGVGTSH